MSSDPSKPVPLEAIEAAAKAIAEHDGWPWHDDDYESPDPKWQPTDKADYRIEAQLAIHAFLDSMEIELEAQGYPRNEFAEARLGPSRWFLDQGASR